MKVTNLMISKWARAVILVILGIILLIYNGPVTEEFEQIFENIADVDASMFFSLMSAIFWIIAIWCFVSAALNIVTSLREQRMTIDDIAAKLDNIEKALQEQQAPQMTQQKKPIIVQQSDVKLEKPEPTEISTGPDVPPPPP